MINIVDTDILSSSLSSRLKYEYLPYSSSFQGDVIKRIVPKGTDFELIMAETEHNLDVSYHLVTIESNIILYPFKKKIGLILGPSISFVLGSHMIEKFRIIGSNKITFDQKIPDWEQLGYKYEDNDKTLVYYDRKTPNINYMRAGFEIGINYTIDFGDYDNIRLIPQIIFNKGLTKLMNERRDDCLDKDGNTEIRDWFVNDLAFGIDLMIGF